MSILPLLRRLAPPLRLSSRLQRRDISYVERVRFLQQLKEHETLCSSLIPDGKFLLYYNSKPLLRVDKANTEETIVWLTYPELTKFYPEILSSFVLLDVSEEGEPRYSVQVGRLPSYEKEKLEDVTGGIFTDLRLGLFMVSWQEAHTLSRANCVSCGTKTMHSVASVAPQPTGTLQVGYSRKCTSCHLTHYPSSAPVGIVVVTDPEHQHIVLVRQPRHPQGMYSCIAGFSDVGESLEETVRREVAEEVGIEVSQVRYIASQHWPFPGSLMTGCFAEVEKQLLVIDKKELQDARWFSREEVKAALARIDANPHLRLRGNPSGELFVPPPGAIAFHLISHWYKRTPIQEIYQHIY
ncbi:Nucleoside diphosphate-linked moiety X motif 13 [Chionoecetes opilio]|uniref:NAD(+) diphosphatase n=1 Tax=Chionoecetes opilio TaxID=41210 RepID=A0A8J4Y3K0_CHIOP|nr:Nucleoside diphosphate-linked moiety X motif 13 [Chionoecetes opilio]